jgi:peptidoglycan/LPS O-acetylase OafA/YrhL
MLNNLQVLRALAATGVVLAHIATLNEAVLMPWLGWGTAGVDLFFVISGFVMVYTTAGKPVGPGQFMLNRIIRIVPLYWALTIAVFAIALVAPALLQSTQASWFDLARSLLFIPFQKNGGLIQPVLFLGWTLNYEMFFYALFALSLALPTLRLRIGIMSVLLAALVLAGLWLRPAATIPLFYTSPLLLEFAFGMALAFLYCRSEFSRWSRLWPWGLLAAGALLGPVIAAVRPDAHSLIARGIPAAFIVWAAVMFEAQGKSYGDRFLLLIGAASYALYLSHPFAFIPLEMLARGAALTSGWVLLPVAAAELAVILAVAVLVHLGLERPMTQWLRARTSGRRTSEARALWPWRLRAPPAGDSRGDKSARGD